MINDTTSYARNVTGFFDTRDAAETARDDLIAAGFSSDEIKIVGQTSTGAATGEVGKGFWESLKDLFMPEEDRYSYAEGLRRGGFIVTVSASGDQYDEALDILDRDGAVNMDERESTWRSEGWAGPQTGASTTSAASLSSGMASTETAGAAASAGYRGTAVSGEASTSTSAMKRATAAGDEETIPVIEEQLRVGKRDTNHGRVRVRSYVVETPVTEDVTLRDTNVEVERRPVDRPVAAGDALFQDRVIEAEQHSEEAVIQKEARVTEEIKLRKKVEERTETVTDKVRRTEVEVEDERGKIVGGSAGSTVTPKPGTPKV